MQHFSRMQDTVALSSGEAELKSTCKGLAEGLGLQAVAEFLTQGSVQLEHLGDAAAALGILKRHGAGGLKHLSVKQLWVQDILRRPHVSTIKIPRTVNMADALCSMPTVETLQRHMLAMGFRRATASEGVC